MRLENEGHLENNKRDGGAEMAEFTEGSKCFHADARIERIFTVVSLGLMAAGFHL